MINEYLEILELTDNNLSLTEVEKKFKFLAKNFHPDINPDLESVNKMKKLIEARNKIKEFLQYSIITKTYQTANEAYTELKQDIFKLIEKEIKILDGYELCKDLWHSIEIYDNLLKDKKNFGVKGGFTRFFVHCGLINRKYCKESMKYSYQKNKCSITSAKKILKLLCDHNLIELIQKGRGINSRLRIIINHKKVADFLINNSKKLGYKLKILDSNI